MDFKVVVEMFLYLFLLVWKQHLNQAGFDNCDLLLNAILQNIAGFVVEQIIWSVIDRSWVCCMGLSCKYFTYNLFNWSTGWHCSASPGTWLPLRTLQGWKVKLSLHWDRYIGSCALVTNGISSIVHLPAYWCSVSECFGLGFQFALPS